MASRFRKASRELDGLATFVAKTAGAAFSIGVFFGSLIFAVYFVGIRYVPSIGIDSLVPFVLFVAMAGLLLLGSLTIIPSVLGFFWVCSFEFFGIREVFTRKNSQEKKFYLIYAYVLPIAAFFIALMISVYDGYSGPVESSHYAFFCYFAYSLHLSLVLYRGQIPISNKRRASALAFIVVVLSTILASLLLFFLGFYLWFAWSTPNLESQKEEFQLISIAAIVILVLFQSAVVAGLLVDLNPPLHLLDSRGKRSRNKSRGSVFQVGLLLVVPLLFLYPVLNFVGYTETARRIVRLAGLGGYDNMTVSIRASAIWLKNLNLGTCEQRVDGMPPKPASVLDNAFVKETADKKDVWCIFEDTKVHWMRGPQYVVDLNNRYATPSEKASGADSRLLVRPENFRILER